MKGVFATALVGLISTAAFGQASSTAPAFEAADVHVSPADATPSGGFLPKGRLEYRATTLLHLITTAYSVGPDQVFGGPNWLDTDRYDVVAQAPGSPSNTAMRTMLQALLAERFGLEVQREDKPTPAYVLELARPGVAKESAGSGEPDCKVSVEEGVRTIACHNMTMASLAQRLQINAAGYFNLPTIDQTGLKGEYDFSLQFLPRGQVPPGPEGNTMSLFTVLEKQLGVKVEKASEPMSVLTVDHVNRTPTPNTPGVAERLAVPVKFDVADIRPSRPTENPNANISNGRIDARGLTLRDLISFAYNVEDDWVKGGERWVASDRFDIMAKTEPTESADALRVMLVALLEERFHLKVHKEPQPVTVYALKTVKAKMSAADTATRSTCRGGLADGQRTITCQNITMAQFADRLNEMNTGYVDKPVVDLTGLKDAYDFTVSYMPRARLEGGGRGGAGRGAGESSSGGSVVPVPADRPVGLTLFEAMERQLGLKLATEKHPMPVVVIDRVDRKPTEN